jgi:hypothetical protein
MKTTSKQSRFAWQSLALALALLAPFGLYLALTHNQPVLAGVIFAILAGSMSLTMWAG